MWNNDAQQEDIEYVKEQVLAKFPLLGVTMMSLPIVPNDKIGTAATDGHQVIYSPKFFRTLTDEQKQFVLAHEVMHVAFNHILRSKGRDPRLWNIATDSVINQILKKEELPLIEGGIDIPEAVNHSAEEMYEKLLKKKERQNQQQNQQGESKSSGGSEQAQEQSQNQNGQQQANQQSDEVKKQNGKNGNSEQNSDEKQKDASENGEQNQSASNSAQADDKQSGNSQNQSGNGSQSASSSDAKDTGGDDIDIDLNSKEEQVGHDTHDIWKKAVEQAEREEQEKQAKTKSFWSRIKDAIGEQKDRKRQTVDAQEIKAPIPKDEKMDAYEKGFMVKNNEKRHEMAEQVREKLNKIKDDYRKKNEHAGKSVGAVGETQEQVVNWKKLLKKSIEEDRDFWSYRRSSSDNDYMARVEEQEDENRPDTEVMLDVSGSVDIYLLREFLRQLKPLLKSSKLKVGCFDEFVYDFKEIKNKNDIDNFKITSTAEWTENWDAAVRAFSPKKEVNKIVFTDGYPCPGTMPRRDLSGKNVIWIVYGNKNFNPCCGKVIQVSKRQICSYINTAFRSRAGR